MSEDLITSPEQVSADWLTAILRERGVLPHGQAEQVCTGEGRSTFASSVWRLDVRYSADVPPGPPPRLFLKCSNPAMAPGEFDPQGLRQEIVFYQTVAPAMDGGAFLIPCYSAVYQPESGASHLLLRDVSASHLPSTAPHSQSHYAQALDALAWLHSFWWDHPLLGKGVGQFPTPAERRKEWSDAAEAVGAFVTHLGDQLPAAWGEIYRGVLAALPELYQRHASGRNLTLAHGDAHLGNFLFPRDLAGTAYLLDWQFWHATIGGTDLAFLLATEAPLEFRRACEGVLLQRYYHALLARGVRDYSWTECWDDYRLSVILVSIFIPVWRWSVFHWEVDYPALERGMTAFADLQCADLL